MERIAILGAGGAGKTVLARQLGHLLGLPVTHLDALRYHPDWSLTSEQEFIASQHRVTAAPAWIIDGNGLATLHLRAAAADTIIVLDPHPAMCLLGILARRLRYRGGQHPDGVFDKISVQFLRYALTYRHAMLPEVLKRIREHGAHATVLHLRSRRAVHHLISDIRHRTRGRP